MKDIIWTLIVIWLIYRVVEIFKRPKSGQSIPSEAGEQTNSRHANQTHSHDQTIRKAVKDHLNKEGEYVDFEEIK